MREEDSSSFLSSCVLDISSFALRPRPKHNGACYAVYDWLLREELLCNVYARVKANRTGAGEIKVRWCYTGSSVKSSKMRKSRHLRKFQAMITYIMALFDNTANQRVPGQLQFNDCTRPSPRGTL